MTGSDLAFKFGPQFFRNMLCYIWGRRFVYIRL